MFHRVLSLIIAVKLETPIRIKHFADLTLKIFTIGYPVKGELVLVTFCDKGRALFTVLTDCYCTGDNGVYNHLDTLHENGAFQQIDVFIWTHPDIDHSLGINRILSTYDPNHHAQVFIPEGLIDNKDSFVKPSQDAVDFLYQTYSSKGSWVERRHVHTVSTDCNEVRDLLMFDVIADDMVTPLLCKFRFVLPYVEHCKHAAYWNTKLLHNLMSIVYSIEINGRNYVFTGDLLDDGTKQMSSEILTRMNYVKIPHHGSNHSNDFLELMRQQNYTSLTSASTRYNPSNDPKEDVLRAYSELGHVYYVTDDNTPKAGCIETVVNIMDDVCVTHCHGNVAEFV